MDISEYPTLLTRKFLLKEYRVYIKYEQSHLLFYPELSHLWDLINQIAPMGLYYSNRTYGTIITQFPFMNWKVLLSNAVP